jgi:hypothetical protein
LEQNAAKQQRLLSEFEAAIGRSQTAWSEQAKGLAQQTLNAALLAARDSTALMLEEAARVWLSLAASAVAFMAAVCAILARVIH